MNPGESKLRQPWSEAELAQLQAMRAENKDRRQIATALGRSEPAVKAKCYEIDLGTPGYCVKRQQRRRSGASFFLS